MKATGRGPRLDLTDLGVDTDHPPLPMEHAVQLTKIPFWKSWPSFFATLIETLPSTVWALSALAVSMPGSSPDNAEGRERWLSGIEWGKRFVDEGEALHYLRDLYGPCYLREVFLHYLQRGKESRTWIIAGGSRVKLQAEKMTGPLVTIKVLPARARPTSTVGTPGRNCPSWGPVVLDAEQAQSRV